MKLKYSIALCSVAIGFVAARAQESQTAPAQSAAPAASAPAAPTFTDTQIVEELGWFYGKRMGLSELEFNKAEMESLVKGLLAAAEGKQAPHDMEKIGPQVEQFMQRKQTAYMERLKKKNSADTEALMAKLKENKNVVQLPSGLRYEIVKPGEGDYPKAQDTVKVHYTGTLIDGTVFDSSVQRNEPLVIALNQVVPGWTEGMQKINKGGKIKLYVPAELGYGDTPRPGIPPGSTLIFDVELLEINPAPEAAAPANAADPHAGHNH